jgi:hypothetical protein
VSDRIDEGDDDGERSGDAYLVQERGGGDSGGGGEVGRGAA